MYLSKLQLDVATRAAQQVLHDPYRLHQALLHGFPADAPGGGGRVLFRVDPGTSEGVSTILVQSVLAPDWEAAEEKAGLSWRSVDGPKKVELGLKQGQRLRFRLRANPTKKVGGKRLAVLGEDAQREWVGRKVGEGGFELLAARLVDEGMSRGRRGREAPPMTFLSVLFDGLVQVAHPVKASETILSGVGAAKAFGFGLLSVARAE